jgi:hypothetical protein
MPFKGCSLPGVRIANEDEPLVFGTRLGPDGKPRKWKEQSGEQYNVCCPICKDERFRLYISYAWGLDDKQKYPTSKLVICHNERCHENFDEEEASRGNLQLWLRQHLRNSYMVALASGAVHIAPVIKERKDEKRIPFPSPDCYSQLDLLPSDHPAAVYVRSRKFDPVVLYKDWGVVYATSYPVQANGKDYSWLAGRIFIPTVGDGWQARDITGTAKAKYFSCPGWKKSEGLYNQERARDYSFTLLCEGVTDVWRVDGPAVCIFGKTLSNEQVMKIKKNWDTVGVLLDPDTENDKGNSLRRAMNQLATAGIKVFRVSLSGEKDAAECEYPHLWDCIERSAASGGFNDVRRPHG